MCGWGTCKGAGARISRGGGGEVDGDGADVSCGDESSPPDPELSTSATLPELSSAKGRGLEPALSSSSLEPEPEPEPEPLLSDGEHTG